MVWAPRYRSGENWGATRARANGNGVGLIRAHPHISHVRGVGVKFPPLLSHRSQLASPLRRLHGNFSTEDMLRGLRRSFKLSSCVVHHQNNSNTGPLQGFPTQL